MKTALLTSVVLCLAVFARGDEGLWIFNQPPREILQQRYHFDASNAWLDHLQKSSVRLSSGGSGGFVSEDGLLISSHTAGAVTIQKLGSTQKNYFRDGFRARTTAEEIKCPDLELDVLESMQDVSARVNAAVTNGTDVAATSAARLNVIAEIEKESQERTGLRSEVVALRHGGAYQLNRFKRYREVRLVFVPERQIACFGGGPDALEFPRFDLDVCFFRAYENGKPAKIKNYFGFSSAGPREGELIFASGHPESTGRSLTVAELRELRDSTIPYHLNQLRRQETLLRAWSEGSEENERRALELLCGTQKDCKRYEGEIAALLDPQLMAAKLKNENDFKAQLGAANRFPGALDAFEKISAATSLHQSQMRRFELLERGRAFDCESFRIAKILLRAADELVKTNGDRLGEFTDSSKASLELSLFSPVPIYPDLEILTLSDALTFAASELRVEFPLMAGILAGKSPHDRAVELINGTRVREVAFRRQIYEGGVKAVMAANDPMIELARLVDLDARELRKVSDEQAEVKQQAHAAIAAARDELTGGPVYPDATDTLRLSFGIVKGLPDGNSNLPPFTFVEGLYDRAKTMKDRPPFDLPATWAKARGRLDGKTHFDFVSTADFAAGSSGAPVVNRQGEWVGMMLDGNRQSLSWNYAYDDHQGRAVSLGSAAIVEILRRVYGAKDLAQELVSGRMPNDLERSALDHELLMSVEKK